jgi:hypothetical protein
MGVLPIPERSSFRRGLTALAVVLFFGACTPSLAPGQLGVLRFAGRVQGAAPLALLPPVADPTGNVYVLYGSQQYVATNVFVGHPGGGWSSGCTLQMGDVYSPHGWAGFAAARDWYWMGISLVAVSGVDGTCHFVLSQDPTTNSVLQMQAVLPWVRDLSERTTLVALVQAPTDPTPYSAVVDLDAEILTNVQGFDPADADNVTIVGVGGDRDQELGVVLLEYTEQGVPSFEARFYDGNGNLVADAPISGGPLGAYAVQGYLQFSSGGLVAGLVSTGTSGETSLVTFNQSGGSVVQIPQGLQAVGVHLWEGNLWLVGVQNSGPVVAPIDDEGNVGQSTPWNASLDTVNSLQGTLPVRDDRSLPSRMTSWTNVVTAMGAYPFLHPHSLTEQATGTGLWLFAGPSIEVGGNTTTDFAMAPVGVSYP